MPILVLLAVMAGSPPEQAARRHYEHAEKLYALGKFQEALTEYEAAYEAKPLPGFLFNIGQCHRNLGDYKQAVFSFKKYLADKPDAKNRDAVEDLISDLEKKVAAQQRRPRPQLEPRLDPQQRDLDLRDPPSEPPREDRPFYGRWWFWTLVGVAAVGAGVGIFAATSNGEGGVPPTGFGNIDFPR